jgi:OFA family oxalate/formate antiporter-like MFS transporter
MIAAGGGLVGLGWAVNADADSLALLYAGAALSGPGAGAIYATCVGNAVKWFPDKRGFAVGLTAPGFGAGAALTVVPSRLTILLAGYQQAFLWFGIGQALVLILASCKNRSHRACSPSTQTSACHKMKLVRPAPRCCVR